MRSIVATEASPGLVETMRHWRSLAPYAEGLQWPIALSVAGAVARSLLVFPTIILLKAVLDTAVPESDASLLLRLGAGLLGIRVAHIAISLALRMLNIRVTEAMVARLRTSLLEALYRWPRSFYTSIDNSELHTAIMQDTSRLKKMVNALLAGIFPSLVSTAILFGLLFYLSWELTLTMLVLVPAMLWVSRVVSKRAQHKVFLFHRAFERLAKGVMFAIRGMDLTRLQAFEDGELRRQRDNVESLRETDRSMAMTYAVYGQIQGTIVALSAIVILVVGGGAVIRSAMTLGEFFAFYFTASLVNQTGMSLLGAVPDMIDGHQSLTTLFGLLQNPAARPYQGDKAVDFRGSIRIDNVSFAYGDAPLLNRVSMSIEHGQRICISGANGSGKSTLLMLLLGFYRPASGALYAEGVAYDELDIGALRRRIGTVLQAPMLFTGSVRENIAYGTPDADDARIEAAARAALAHDFIVELDQGYDTELGDEAQRLSGGQRQRISIARALLREPALLVLDEPTTYLDRPTVTRLIDSMARLPYSPAILTVSHDVELLRDCDEAYHLEAGILERVSASKTHVA